MINERGDVKFSRTLNETHVMTHDGLSHNILEEIIF